MTGEARHSEATSLEPPTGQRAVRGPTAFVFGVLIVVAIVGIVQRCMGAT